MFWDSSLTLRLAKAQGRLLRLAVAEVGVDRIDPGVAAPSVEEEADILGGCADRELGVVAAAGDVVEGLERKGLVVALDVGSRMAELLAGEGDGDMAGCGCGGREADEERVVHVGGWSGIDVYQVYW